MKILIVVENSPKQWFLVSLTDNKSISDIKMLINRKMNERAIMTVFSKGSFVNIVEYREVPSIKADLILSRNNVNWCITSA